MSRQISKAVKLYPALLDDIKARITHAQTRAMQSVNVELVRLYWEIGKLILARQKIKGWGAGVIPRLARDLNREMPDLKGFSERNIKLMVQFANEYPTLFSIGQPPVAQLQPAAFPPDPIGQPVVAQLSLPSGTDAFSPIDTVGRTQTGVKLSEPLVAKLPWAHNILLMQSVKDLPTRIWYMHRAIAHGWSRNVLALMIDGQIHLREGKAVTNFSRVLPPAQSDLANQLLKDPYVFDFLTLREPFQEKELEETLLNHLEKFLIELGQGFAFVGRQVRFRLGDRDYTIDLLFYQLRLRCFLAIDLKSDEFDSGHAGKMNLHLNFLDDRMRHPSDNPSIGLILCRKRNRIVAEYALRGIDKPIGVSEFRLTRALPAEFKSSLPSIETIEAELAGHPGKNAAPRARRQRKPFARKRRK